MDKFSLFYVVFLCLIISCDAQEVVPLYNGNIPNSIKSAKDLEHQVDGSSIVLQVSKPTLSIYLPHKTKASGTAIIICPGGGFQGLVIDREGYAMAKRLIKIGITAFVLKYRLPSDRTMVNKSIGPIEDAQRAIQMVRSNAKKWKINPHKIGIMGFSAGGHLASTAGTHFERNYIVNNKNINLRPDFMVLVYPVISMTDSIGHIGSRNNLLGLHPSDSLIREFSNELEVTANTPPAFITQAADDNVVKIENSIHFFQALHKHDVPAALHIYQKGGHGFLKYPPRSVWMYDLKYWLKKNSFL